MLKPAVSVRHLLLAAAFLWSGIGLLLLGRGWCLLGRHSLAAAALAIGVGSAKGLLVLDRAARRNIARIRALPDGTCIGAVYSLRMWGVVLLMIVLGRLLRMSPATPVVVGFLLMAVGWGLFFSSRLIWLQWRDPGMR